MLKNKRFNIFGTSWILKFIDKPVYKDEERTVYGETNFNKREIKVSTKDSEGKPRLQSEIDIVILHELMHCIFGEGQYHLSNSDEPLVEWCARSLYSLRKQGIL